MNNLTPLIFGLKTRLVYFWGVALLVLSGVLFLVPLPSALAVTATVTTTNDSGFGSLRDAITMVDNNQANAITFSIGNGLQTINLLSALPPLTHTVTIDASTQPGYAGAPLIELNGSGISGTANGLEFQIDTSTVKGLVINNFSGSGILIANSSADNTTIKNCYIGTNAAGTLAAPNGDGIKIVGASNTTIGGTTNTIASNTISGDSNVIAGNTGNGIYVLGSGAINNRVFGNYIGLNVNGNALKNTTGINLENATDSKIGDGTNAGRNIIAGNDPTGVLITGSAATTGNNKIYGNYIGTGSDGLLGRPNHYGIKVDGSPNNWIGGTVSGDGNVIAANSTSGVLLINSGASANNVLGNYIGLDKTGSTALANGYGVTIDNAPNNKVGDNDAITRNIISGNVAGGVSITETLATGNIVEGNYIGTDASGLAPIANLDGVEIYNASNNTVGGNGSGQKNVISGNSSNGIVIMSINGGGTSNNNVYQNYIGLKADGSAALPNNYGVRIDNATNNTVGGIASVFYRNIISGNTTAGVYITGAAANGNTVLGDYIGLDPNGTTAIGNGTGIILNAPGNTIGALDGGTFRTIISGNTSTGLTVTGGGAVQNQMINTWINLKSDATALSGASKAIVVNTPGRLKLSGDNKVRG
jgi:hypothetical protein